MTVNSNRDGAHGPSTATPPVLNMPAIQLSDPLSLPRSESQGSSISPDAGRRYNVQNLPWRITSDLTAAACASLLVAPLIAMIDKYVRSVIPSLLGFPLTFNPVQRNHRKCVRAPPSPCLPSILSPHSLYSPAHLHNVNSIPPDHDRLLWHVRHGQLDRHNLLYAQPVPSIDHHSRPC